MYKLKLETVNPNIEIVGEYINQTSYLDVKCKTCGHRWKVVASSLLRGHGCPACKGKQHSLRARKSHQAFIEQLHSVNPHIQVLGEYIGKDNKILCRCLICSECWEATPGNLLYGSGCPRCRKSKGEKYVQECLEKMHVPFITQYSHPQCKNIIPLRFDFAIMSNNSQEVIALIEYDGEQHYKGIDFSGRREFDKSLQKVQYNDNIKNQFCKNNNIPLLRIPYWEYDNISQILNTFLSKIQNNM